MGWNLEAVGYSNTLHLNTYSAMAFARLSAIVALALGASQLASAATVAKRAVTCPTGQTTAHAACCGPYYLNCGEDLVD